MAGVGLRREGLLRAPAACDGAHQRDDAGKLIPMDVKVGDRVLFGKYSGQTVKVDGEEFLVMREEDIMGVVA